jgi:hypothetical protein
MTSTPSTGRYFGASRRAIEVAVDHEEEHGAEADGGDGADGQALPEDRTQPDLAEPEPVHIQPGDDDGQNDDRQGGDGRSDRNASPHQTAPATSGVTLVGLLRGRTANVHSHPERIT